MAITPLSTIHDSFSVVIQNEHQYLALNTENGPFVVSEKKQTSLAQIFITATAYITPLHSQKQSRDSIHLIRSLKTEGQQLYQRYQRKTETFWRSLVREIQNIATWLFPSCFSNPIQQAEETTKAAYDSYMEALKGVQFESRLSVAGKAVGAQGSRVVTGAKKLATRAVQAFERSKLGKVTKDTAAGIVLIAQGQVTAGMGSFACAAMTASQIALDNAIKVTNPPLYQALKIEKQLTGRPEPIGA
jgi:hypothetical protein